MKRIDFIKESETTREMAEFIIPIVCENKDCNHDCAKCTEEVEKFLEEEL